MRKAFYSEPLDLIFDAEPNGNRVCVYIPYISYVRPLSEWSPLDDLSQRGKYYMFNLNELIDLGLFND